MSKITLEPNSSGAGTFSIVSPDSNINRTLALPDDSGELLLASSLDFASDSDVRDGSSTNKIVTPSNIDDTIFSMGQSWVDVTSNRSFETTFTNTTGRPIMVIITLRGSSGSEALLVIDGVTVYSCKQENTDFTRTPTTAVVPNGSTYRLNNPALAIDRWVELR